MRIGMQTWGSDGDIRPLIALAGGLRLAGNEVTIAVASVDNKDYSELCHRLDVNYRKVPEQILLDLPTMLTRIGGNSGPKILKLLFEEAYFPHQEVMYDAAVELCRDCQLVVGHFAMHPLKLAAMQAGVPHASVLFWPGLLSCDQPLPRLPHLGRLLNRGLWKVVQWALDFYLKGPINTFCQRHGEQSFRHVLPDAWSSESLNLVAASPLLWKQTTANWPGSYRMSGYLHVPESAESAELPPDLRRFLEDGPAPVYMTFGSSGQVDPERGTELLIAAAKQTRCRAVIQTFSPHFPPGAADGGLFFAGRMPHPLIFPYCAAVVHHGGAGTTHSVCRAGKPSVVVGFSDEQLSWGRQLHDLGLGAKPLSYYRVRAETLATPLRWVLDTPTVSARAAEVGQAMQQEDGVAIAVNLLGSMAAR